MALIDEQTDRSDSHLDSIRELVESFDQIIFVVAADLGRVFYVSPSYERVTGHSCDRLYENPRAWFELIDPQDRAFVEEMVKKRLSGELHGESEMEYRIRTASGETHWLRNRITPIVDESGQNVRLAGVAEDITARKKTELIFQAKHAELACTMQVRTQELSQTVTRLQQEIEDRKRIETQLRISETWFRQITDANIIGVAFADIYGNVSDANEAFLKMTGYSRDDLPLRWDKMTPPEWSHSNELAIQQLVREGRVSSWEKEYLRKDGTRVPVLLGSALLDSDTWQCVTFILDLSLRKKAEEQVREVNLQLEHASRLSAMGELLANLAHEIHQPLGVIVNFASGSLRYLNQRELTEIELKDVLNEIADASHRVSQIVRRIREFLRRREPEHRSVNLNLMVMDGLQCTRLERQEHRVAVTVRLADNLPTVLADGTQIVQVLVNLLLNAIQAVAAGDTALRRIVISTCVNEAGFDEISIADNGPGIAAAEVPLVFDRFFTTKPGGLGLGLSISRSIIESHGGKLSCDSTPGEGTVFRITLPVHNG